MISLLNFMFALQSWLYGKAIQYVEPDAIALHTSHGYETHTSKTLMRWSVVVSDVLGAVALSIQASPVSSWYNKVPAVKVAATQFLFPLCWRVVAFSSVQQRLSSGQGCCLPLYCNQLLY